MITALRYDILCRSSSLISSACTPANFSTSSNSFRCRCCSITRCTMIHCSVVAVVSMPTIWNSKQRLTNSSSVSSRSPLDRRRPRSELLSSS
ncbi:hypothetical protein MUK42_11673 [Musa troglodytarum]|uniref:Uncharacterized protein n=1 Tax=Musa troglodytarum TaxID=320322 RepID=A0A9E7GTK0_9LILI|nr:hypothetical protein MUK42_11673 [Musa troglodytarum]